MRLPLRLPLHLPLRLPTRPRSRSRCRTAGAALTVTTVLSVGLAGSLAATPPAAAAPAPSPQFTQVVTATGGTLTAAYSLVGSLVGLVVAEREVDLTAVGTSDTWTWESGGWAAALTKQATTDVRDLASRTTAGLGHLPNGDYDVTSRLRVPLLGWLTTETSRLRVSPWTMPATLTGLAPGGELADGFGISFPEQPASGARVAFTGLGGCVGRDVTYTLTDPLTSSAIGITVAPDGSVGNDAGALATATGALQRGCRYDIAVTWQNQDLDPAFPDLLREGQRALTRVTGVVLAALPTSPGAVDVTPSQDQLDVTWAPPAQGAEGVVRYVVTAGSHSCSTSASVLSCLLTGLVGGTTYEVVVTAYDSLDRALGSTTVPGTPFTAVTAPSSVSATPGDRSATVTWSGGSGGGRPEVRYTATAQPGGQTCQSEGSQCTITGLTNGTGYVVTVRTGAVGGSSGESTATATVTPRGVAAAPRTLSATATSSSARLRWTAPSDDGGAPVTQYVVTSAPASAGCRTTATTCAVPGLEAGRRYTFSVRALNEAGTGAAATAVRTTGRSLAASVGTQPKRQGISAARVLVDLNQRATVVVRMSRGKLAATRKVTLGTAPTWVRVPVARPKVALLDGKRVTLQVRTTAGKALTTRAARVVA